MSGILWTQDMEDELAACKRAGLSHTKTAKRLGISRGAVSGKIWRQQNPKVQKLGLRVKEDCWERKLFEPYSVRKARLAAEGRV